MNLPSRRFHRRYSLRISRIRCKTCEHEGTEVYHVHSNSSVPADWRSATREGEAGVQTISGSVFPGQRRNSARMKADKLIAAHHPGILNGRRDGRARREGIKWQADGDRRRTTARTKEGSGEKTASCNSLPIVQARYSSVHAVNFNAVYTPAHILRAVNCPSERIAFVSDLSIPFPSTNCPSAAPNIRFSPFFPFETTDETFHKPWIFHLRTEILICQGCLFTGEQFANKHRWLMHSTFFVSPFFRGMLTIKAFTNTGEDVP